VDSEEVPLHLQCEVTERQCSAVYWNKHRESSLCALCKSLDSETYKHLTEVALETFSIFRSTNLCVHFLYHEHE
jgi:hypothetical protein